MDLTERSWRKLAQSLERAHERPFSARVADQAVRGWLYQAAPCHQYTCIADLCDRITVLAREYGFEELPVVMDYRQVWEQAVDAWLDIKSRPLGSIIRAGDVPYSDIGRDDSTVPF